MRRMGSKWSCTKKVTKPADWLKRVEQPETEAELTALRRCIVRGRPFGNEKWLRETAEHLGLESTLKPVGRPQKIDESKEKQ